MEWAELITRILHPDDPAKAAQELGYWKTALAFAVYLVGSLFALLLGLSKRVRAAIVWLFELQPYRVTVRDVRKSPVRLMFQPDRYQCFWSLGWRGQERITQIVYRGRVVNNADFDAVLLDAYINRPRVHSHVSVRHPESEVYSRDYPIRGSSLTPMSADFYADGIVFDRPTDRTLDVYFVDNNGNHHRVRNVPFRCVATAADFAATAPPQS